MIEMISQFKLIGLSRPSSATIELYDGVVTVGNVKYDFPESLWKYCKNNWDNVNLIAIVKHDGFDNGIPVNPVVIRVEEI